MLSVNNAILQTTAAANGAWRKIDDWTSLSVHVIGLEAGSDVWIEVSNNPLCDPVLSAATSPTTAGVPITGNLAANTVYSPPVTGDSGDEQDISFSADGTQAMWSPSCLIWNFIRACKSGGGSVQTTAYLFGQIG